MCYALQLCRRLRKMDTDGFWLAATLVSAQKKTLQESASKVSRRKEKPCRLPFQNFTHKTLPPTNGRVHTVPASVHCEPVCCAKASVRATVSAITAGQSSAASWVSIGHGSTVHYHMGVATSSLLKKCFQLRSKGGTQSAWHACTGPSPHLWHKEMRGWWYKKKLFTSLKLSHCRGKRWEYCLR